MRKRLTAKQAEKFPRRQYDRLQILKDFRVRLSGLPQGQVVYETLRVFRGLSDLYWYDSYSYCLDVLSHGKIIYGFHVRRGRVRGVFFPGHLTVIELAGAIEVMREEGLASWVLAGLRSVRKFLSRAPIPDANKISDVDALIQKWERSKTVSIVLPPWRGA